VRLLVLGGTVFVGRHVAEAALAAGWTVTLFSRGIHGAPPAGTEHLTGDRHTDLAPLRGRQWDRVVDTSGFEPAAVAASATALAGSCDRYVFVSSASVYRDWPEWPVASLKVPPIVVPILIGVAPTAALTTVIGGERVDIKLATTATEDPEKTSPTPGMISAVCTRWPYS